MKALIEIDRAAALLAGRDQYGPTVVSFDPADLTDAERVLLVACPDNNLPGGARGPDLTSTGVEGRLLYSNAPPRPVVADASDPTAAVRAWLAWRGDLTAAARALIASEAAKAAAEKAEREQQADAYIAYWRDQPAFCFVGHSDMAALPDNYQSGEPRPPFGAVNAELTQRIRAALADKLSEAEAIIGQRKAEREAKKAAAEKAEADKAARRSAQLAAWVREHGTDNQQARFRLGKLPEREALDAMRAATFADLEGFARFQRITFADLEHAPNCASDCCAYAGEDAPMRCETSEADAMSAAEFDLYALIEGAAPVGAVLAVRDHLCTCEDCDASLTRRAVLVTVQVGEFALSREFALSE